MRVDSCRIEYILTSIAFSSASKLVPAALSPGTGTLSSAFTDTLSEILRAP
jgi:hypothetical protein